MIKNLKHNAVYDSDIPVTLKQGQGQQTWYDLADPKQGYKNAQFKNKKFKKKNRLNSVREKANDEVFVKSGNTSVITLAYVQKFLKKIVVYSLAA